MQDYDLDTIRKQIIGNTITFPTPFGDRHLLYADYTASGRGVHLIEERMQNILAAYGNTHTMHVHYLSYAGRRRLLRRRFAIRGRYLPQTHDWRSLLGCWCRVAHGLR